MKAKDLIALLQTIDQNAEVVTPGFDEYGVADSFTLQKVGIMFNVRGSTPHFAPNDYVEYGTQGSVDGYLLNGDW